MKQRFLKWIEAVALTFSVIKAFCCIRFQFTLHSSQDASRQLLSRSQVVLSRISFLLFSVYLVFLLSGCEKVIDVDLNETEPAIVIEGNLSFPEGKLEVKVSKTGSYFSNEPIQTVENAEVYLENGPAFRLRAEETGKGIYKLTHLPANFNSAYRLTVNVGDEQYSGVSILKPRVKIDSLNYEYQQEQPFFDGGYRLLLYFNDPAEEENYYRVKVYKNDEQFNTVDDIIVFDDDGFNGKSLSIRLRGQRFEKDDTAKVELLSIDKSSWEYFSTLSEVANLNPGSPSPANPASNLSNDALGYFSVWALSTGIIVIR